MNIHHHIRGRDINKIKTVNKSKLHKNRYNILHNLSNNPIHHLLFDLNQTVHPKRLHKTKANK